MSMRRAVEVLLALTTLMLIDVRNAAAATPPRGLFRVNPRAVFLARNAQGRAIQCAAFGGTFIAGRLVNRRFFQAESLSTRTLERQLRTAARRRNTRLIARLTLQLNLLRARIAENNQRCVWVKIPPTPTPSPTVTDSPTATPTVLPTLPAPATQTPTPGPTVFPTPVPTPLPPPSGDAVSLQQLDRPMIEDDVHTFLERAGFGLSQRERWLIPIAVNQGVAAFVDQFMATRTEDAGVWDRVLNLLDGQLDRDTTQTPTGQREALFSLWTHTNNPYAEKLALFLLSTWTVAGDVIGDETFRFVFWDYFNKLRQAAYDSTNMPELGIALTRDPLMLIYLNNELNVRGNPNENYARELMELFTLGTDDLDGNPNYTETRPDGSGDIAVAARALTGWRIRLNYSIPEITVSFEQGRHASGPHIMFAGTAHQFSAENDADVVRGIFEHHPNASIYYAKELLNFYLTPNPPRELIEQFAAVIRQENFLLRPSLSRLFRSKAFFHTAYRDTLAKNAIEFAVEVVKILQLEDAYDDGETDRLFFRTVMPVNYAPSVFWFNSAAWTSAALSLDRANFVARLLGDTTAHARPDPDWSPDTVLPNGAISAANLLIAVANQLGIPRIPDNAELQLESYMNRERQWNGSYSNRPYDNTNAEQRRRKGLGAFYVLFAMPEFVMK